MSAYRKLKPQQRRFVDLIIRRLHTPTAAIRTIRPKTKRPDVLASKWKALPQVREAIEERELEAMEQAGITNAQILLDIAAIANVSVKALVWQEGERADKTPGMPKLLHELDDETARIVQAIEFEGTTVKVKLPSRLEARKLLGQYKKLFTQKHELDVGETLEQLIAASMKPPSEGEGAT